MANPETRRAAKPLAAKLLRALHAEWRKFSPNLDIEPLEGETPKDAERRVRLEWTNETLNRKSKIENRKLVTSWSLLSTGEAKRLIKIMRDELGESPLNDYIARAAVRLFGANWNDALAERIAQRFKRGPEIAALEFWMKKALFEELVGRIARQELGSRIQDLGEETPSTPNPKSEILNPSPSELAARTETIRMEIVRGKA